MCKTFAELCEKVVPPSRRAPSDQEAVYFLNDYEKMLFNERQEPDKALSLTEIVEAKLSLKLNGEHKKFIPYLADDWGVYLKPLKIMKEKEIELLCIKVKSLCPEHKLECELYRPSLNGGQVIAESTKKERAAFVSISCLKDQFEYHANRDDISRMQECLELIEEIENILYPSIRQKYGLGEDAKISFNQNWQVVI